LIIKVSLPLGLSLYLSSIHSPVLLKETDNADNANNADEGN